MTWHAAEMPDDALPPDSLVRRIIDSDKVRPELIADAMEFMDAYDSDLQAMADRERAELPLWRVIHAGYWTEAGVDVDDDFPPPVPECYAAEIEALRDWLLPEEPYCSDNDLMSHYVARTERQRLRALLTDQARIARGD